MNILQQKIEERAIEKLKKDLSFLDNMDLNQRNKFKDLYANITINIEEYPEDLENSSKLININIHNIFSSYYRIYKEAYSNNLSKYIKTETELFLKEVEGLKEKLDKLEDQVNNITL